MIPVWLQMANILLINFYNLGLKSFFDRSSLKGDRAPSKSTSSYSLPQGFFNQNSFSRFLDISIKRSKKALFSCTITKLDHTLYGKVKDGRVGRKFPCPDEVIEKFE